MTIRMAHTVSHTACRQRADGFYLLKWMELQSGSMGLQSRPALVLYKHKTLQSVLSSKKMATSVGEPVVYISRYLARPTDRHVLEANRALLLRREAGALFCACHCTCASREGHVHKVLTVSM